MRVGVVLAGLVVAIVAGGRELLQPHHHVVLEAALPVVHPDAGGDVHRRDEAHALPGRPTPPMSATRSVMLISSCRFVVLNQR
jgi:hypothetical protein